MATFLRFYVLVLVITVVAAFTLNGKPQRKPGNSWETGPLPVPEVHSTFYRNIVVDEEPIPETGSDGAAQTMQASALRNGGFVVIKGRPCKIVKMSTSEIGRHGDMIVYINGLDIFTDKECNDIAPSTHNMNVPNVIRKEYKLIGVTNGFCTLKDDAGENKEFKLHDDNGTLSKEIKDKAVKGEDSLVTVLSAMGEKKIVAVKALTS